MSDVLCHHRQRDPFLRRRSLDVRRWALARGQGIDPDSLTVVLRVIDDDRDLLGVSPHEWTAERVLEFIWARAWSWCEAEGLTLPPTAPATLLAYLDHLHDTNSLTPSSDPITELRDQLVATSHIDHTYDTGAPLAPVLALPVPT
ncbi:MAG: hypothetical protein GY745_20490 [Actinomycetia bacterium]|nr:hypothetical protein [Actinomycetes bacterium]MCP4087401.1 hypothetical protein [Actinomycetes bacterium]